jgi:hypothetical protein
MKKFIFILILLGAVGSSVVIYLGVKNGFNFDTGIQTSTELTELDPNIAEINDILSDVVVDDQILFEEPVIEEQPVTTRLPVMSNLKSAKLFENPFIRFSYPGYIEFKNETLNFIEIFQDEASIGTINIYADPEDLSLQEFVKKDNLIDYFTESSLKGIEMQEFNIPTAVSAFKFEAYPELNIADIYLLKFNGVIVVAKDYSTDKVVGEYLVRSMEKVR